jgi:hypothetical protein
VPKQIFDYLYLDITAAISASDAYAVALIKPGMLFLV